MAMQAEINLKKNFTPHLSLFLYLATMTYQKKKVVHFSGV
jgi:hypothetical protein